MRGSDLSSEQLYEHYSPKINKSQYYRNLSVGEVGCFLSHRKAWQKIVDENLKFGVILEDDFLLKGDVKEALSIIEAIRGKWDYIKLAGYYSRPCKILDSDSKENHTLVRYTKLPAGTCAQAVSYNGAKNLLKNTDKFGRPIDVDLQFWWEKEISVYGLNPYTFLADEEEESEISRMASRKDTQRRVFRRFWQQASFKINSYIRNYLLRKQPFC